MMEPLQQDGELPEEPLDAGAEAELPDELDPSVLAANLEAVRAENARLEQRVKDNQASFHRADQERQRLQSALAEAAVGGRQQVPQQQQPQSQSWRPPRLTEDQAAEWAMDPQKINDAIWQASAFAAQTTAQQIHAQYQPVIGELVQQVQAHAATLPAAVEPAAVHAATQAMSVAEAGFGVPRDQFVAYLPAANEMMWAASGGNQAAFNQLRMNPRAVAHAVADARYNAGGVAAPVGRPAAPPTIGSAPRSAAPVARRPVIPESASAIEAALHTKFTPEQLKQIAEAR